MITDNGLRVLDKHNGNQAGSSRLLHRDQVCKGRLDNFRIKTDEMLGTSSAGAREEPNAFIYQLAGA
jgi:hypothetical protein